MTLKGHTSIIGKIKTDSQTYITWLLKDNTAEKRSQEYSCDMLHKGSFRQSAQIEHSFKATARKGIQRDPKESKTYCSCINLHILNEPCHSTKWHIGFLHRTLFSYVYFFFYYKYYWHVKAATDISALRKQTHQSLNAIWYRAQYLTVLGKLKQFGCKVQT